MMLVDTNVLMYASGAEHPNKALATAFLRRVATGDVSATLDAEVLQEIIQRYSALRRWEEGRKVYSLARTLFPDVLAITGSVVDGARTLVDQMDGLTARDAIHASVVSVYNLEGICTFDCDFDRIPGCKRIQP